MTFIRKKAARGRGASASRKSGERSGSQRKGAQAAAGPRKTKRRPQRTLESREGGVRLNKYLADRGIASRRAADELIAEGHVTVDGVRVEELGLKVDPEQQSIEIDGEPLEPTRRETKRYYLLNKPTGVVCTNERRETRPRAIDLITDRAKGRIYTVGRLDEESKGLLILTNDGEFANRIMHPRFGVSKTYAVKLRGRIEDADVQRVREGVYLAEGRAGQMRIVVVKRTRDYSHLEVTLHEGKNREIRRIFHSVGFKVAELRRTHIGTVTDRKIKIGFWRFLEPEEVAELLALSAQEESPAAAARRAVATRSSGQGARGARPRRAKSAGSQAPGRTRGRKPR
jgi:23S rRNA pseudouridine2605 synthase